MTKEHAFGFFLNQQIYIIELICFHFMHLNIHRQWYRIVQQLVDKFSNYFIKLIWGDMYSQYRAHCTYRFVNNSN